MRRVTVHHPRRRLASPSGRGVILRLSPPPPPLAPLGRLAPPSGGPCGRASARCTGAGAGDAKAADCGGGRSSVEGAASPEEEDDDEEDEDDEEDDDEDDDEEDDDE